MINTLCWTPRGLTLTIYLKLCSNKKPRIGVCFSMLIHCQRGDQIRGTFSPPSVFHMKDMDLSFQENFAEVKYLYY